MANYIAIDGGTTNTRIMLVKDSSVVDTLKLNIGARAGIDDRALLENSIKNGIEKILSENNLCSGDIKRILASGMITSEFGLHKLDHLTVPAGMDELHGAMEEVYLKNISDIPFVFMRGVKTQCSSLEDADMMRGEETELMGIAQGGECVYVLPGSHSKIISTDKDGKITDFVTMLTGEMAAALAQNTILKDAVSFDVSGVSEEYLLKGFDMCSDKGINEALFKVRILKNIFGAASLETYSFFMGVILCDEIKCILVLNPKKIVIGGKKQIKEQTVIILKARSQCEIIQLEEEDVDVSSAMGMIKIYEHENGE